MNFRRIGKVVCALLKTQGILWAFIGLMICDLIPSDVYWVFFLAYTIPQIIDIWFRRPQRADLEMLEQIQNMNNQQVRHLEMLNDRDKQTWIGRSLESWQGYINEYEEVGLHQAAVERRKDLAHIRVQYMLDNRPARAAAREIAMDDAAERIQAMIGGRVEREEIIVEMREGRRQTGGNRTRADIMVEEMLARQRQAEGG